MINEIESMISDGLAIRRIANKLGVTASEIKNIVNQHGFKIKKEEFSENKIERICDLYILGVSAKNLGYKFSIDKRRVQRWVKERGKLRGKNESHRFTNFDEHYFDVIDWPDKAYWLGFLYADAYNSDKTNTISLSLQVSDKEHLENLARAIKLPQSKIKFTQTTLGYEYYTLRMYSKHMCNKLSELGCPRAKSFIITFPKWLRKDLYNHFIRGLFDGDGCLTFRENQKEWKWSLVSTKECCDRIQRIFLQQLGFIVNYHCISRTGNNTYELETSGNEKISIIMDWLYVDSLDSARLKRKYKSYKKLMAQQDNRRFSRKSYRVSDSDFHEILGKIKSGEKMKNIADKYEVHPRTVYKIKHKNQNKFERIVEIGEQAMTAQFIKPLSKSEREKLVSPIFSYFREQGWLYPSFSNRQLIQTYKKLCDYEPNLEKASLYNNSSLATNICKHFCQSFFHATERGKKNMVELWEDDDILRKLVENRLVINWDSKVNETFNISHRMMIQGMRSMRLVPGITMFKPAIAKYMCMKYSEPGDVVGDYSCGFGGRLLGAMSCGRKYIGTDPLTVPELEKMKEFFNFGDCALIQSGSEYYCGDENSVDLYWSSPPYFDYEYYSSDSTQAYNKGEDYFYNTYWKKTLENIRHMLKPGKWFGLNVKNYPKMLQMTEKTFGEIKDEVHLRTVRSHLNKSAGVSKIEKIYMFKNMK